MYTINIREFDCFPTDANEFCPWYPFISKTDDGLFSSLTHFINHEKFKLLGPEYARLFLQSNHSELIRAFNVVWNESNDVQHNLKETDSTFSIKYMGRMKSFLTWKGCILSRQVMDQCMIYEVDFTKTLNDLLHKYVSLKFPLDQHKDKTNYKFVSQVYPSYAQILQSHFNMAIPMLECKQTLPEIDVYSTVVSSNISRTDPTVVSSTDSRTISHLSIAESETDRQDPAVSNNLWPTSSHLCQSISSIFKHTNTMPRDEMIQLRAHVMQMHNLFIPNMAPCTLFDTSVQLK